MYSHRAYVNQMAPARLLVSLCVVVITSTPLVASAAFTDIVTMNTTRPVIIQELEQWSVRTRSAHAQYKNVLGGELHKCSGYGMALTGFTRNGKCVNHNDDIGSHHVCIDMHTLRDDAEGRNFCTVTGQDNWCVSSMKCDGSAGECRVAHWCVCEWAFARYIQKAGGCAKIEKIVCEATNRKALTHYRAKAASDPHIAEALKCLKTRCMGESLVQE
eukprot:GEMP01054191.1.p1 GENE.GEMP01054191.1~~GEMP01054191.1.p1  ORF type:complete len:216 (+),score=48.33 GEMP01054191.1:240-887(+)